MVTVIEIAVGVRNGHKWPKTLLLALHIIFIEFFSYEYTTTNMIMVPRKALLPFFLQASQ